MKFDDMLSDQEGLVSEENYNVMFSSVSRMKGQTSCDHLASLSADLTNIPPPHTPCHRCQHQNESWLCLSCKQVLCSRYVNKHMLHHFQDTNHSVALSFEYSHHMPFFICLPNLYTYYSSSTFSNSDLAFWCYSCKAFLDAQLISELRPVHEVVYKLKFGDSINASSNVRNSPKLCKCGVLSKLQLSWFKNNPARRFYGCGKYNGSITNCDYLIWYDPPTNKFHANLFNNIVEEIKELKLEVKAHRESALEKFGASSRKNKVSSTLNVESSCDLQNYIKNLKVEVEVQKTNLEVLQKKVSTETAQVELLTRKVKCYNDKVKTLNFIILSFVMLLVGKWV